MGILVILGITGRSLTWLEKGFRPLPDVGGVVRSVLLNVARVAPIEFSLSATIAEVSRLSKIRDTLGVNGAERADDLPELQLISAVFVLPYTASEVTIDCCNLQSIRGDDLWKLSTRTDEPGACLPDFSLAVFAS